MRSAIALVISVIAVALSVCTNIAHRSGREISHKLALLLTALIPPVLGNLLIIIAHGRLLATIGSYVYFLGMDYVMYALLAFTLKYCRIKPSWPWGMRLVYLVLVLDGVQLLCNPIFGHAFALEEIVAYGAPYFRLVPFAGQMIHRVVDYGIFFAVLGIFLHKTIYSPRIYTERYSIILASMIFTGLWETFYIFSRTPIDRSMIGYGVFGLLVFYFSLYYRPMRLLDHMLAKIASGMNEALFFFDDGDRCVWANEKAESFAGISEDSYDDCVKKLRAIFPSLDMHTSGWVCDRIIGEGEQAQYFHIEKHEVTEEQDRIVGSYLSVRDETVQQRTLQRERYNATHDSLTGLYTKEYLYYRVYERIKDNPGKIFYVSYMDIDNFKMVNDVFGREFGDFVLRSLADSLRENLPPDSLYGRLAGDCFGLFFTQESFDPIKASRLMSRFKVKSGTIEHHLVIHQGVYKVTGQDLDVSAMFDRAHIAQLTIKNEYKKHLAMYDDSMREQMLWEQHISAQLPEALALKQICPYLQAMVDTTGRVIGCEALVRWIHPVDGFLPPNRFVPTFEKNGMIADVDRFMWRSACEALARWKSMGNDDLFISINISPKDFYFMDVFAELKGIVEEYGVDPGRLRIEITESTMMTDSEKRIGILQKLRSAGFLVEMDDFGSGYSSLNMLKDMPVDVLKIDMVFLNETKDSIKSQTILHNILNMSNDLGILPLTEGVETEKQYRMLSGMGCKMFQGYYFAKPMPVQQFEELFLRGGVGAKVKTNNESV